ncbi:hypothetical protein GGX14DRAFT_698625 [Mycena pura]|uniref:Uncharacterized protein n=1 Tax=Mycena pura TaxID=153505 RepID=A0AAD6V7S3_9AGAR|nr:hypothetical protein GGX14DRAFT_698625 [Mycena pura]
MAPSPTASHNIRKSPRLCWVVRVLLEEGSSVRGAVRSVDKCAHLCELFAAYGNKFELALFPDITQAAGDFDEAAKGADDPAGASATFTSTPTYEARARDAGAVEPAIRGTVGILESARKYGSEACRRDVAVLAVSDQPQFLAPREVEEKGRAALRRRSHVVSGTAGWDYVVRHGTEIGWDLVVLNPPLVLGAAASASSSPPAPSRGRTVDVAPPASRYQKGSPGVGKDHVHLHYNNWKSVRVLGMEYRSMADTAAQHDLLMDGWHAPDSSSAPHDVHTGAPRLPLLRKLSHRWIGSGRPSSLHGRSLQQQNVLPSLM